jgi:hypothetical protein
MKLLNRVGWFCSKLDKPVLYNTSYFTTVQDYMRKGSVNILLYDKLTKKRRQVTLKIPTEDRDTRKTGISTCVNIIHQKDANIAMKMIEELISIGAPSVHDNFITTALYARQLPELYTRAFVYMGPPLRFINELIYLNLISQFQSAEDLPEPDLLKDILDSDYNMDEPLPIGNQISSF